MTEREKIERGAQWFQFKDRRRGLLSPFGKDVGGVYEITDSTRKLAARFADDGLIEVCGQEERPAYWYRVHDLSADVEEIDS